MNPNQDDDAPTRSWSNAKFAPGFSLRRTQLMCRFLPHLGRRGERTLWERGRRWAALESPRDWIREWKKEGGIESWDGPCFGDDAVCRHIGVTLDGCQKKNITHPWPLCIVKLGELEELEESDGWMEENVLERGQRRTNNDDMNRRVPYLL